MRDRHLRLVLLLPLLATAAAPLAGEPPAPVVCRGHEPEWNLRIDGAAATLATIGTAGLLQTGFDGRLQETAGKPPSFVYRGRTGPSGRDLVAMITQEACVDTIADAAEGGRASEYTARVSLPDGTNRLGCCSIAPTLAPRPEGEPLQPPAVAAVSPATSTPVPAPAPPPAAFPGGRGEVTAVTLSDGRECPSTGKGTTAASRGQRLSFDCGHLGGDRLGLVGPLTPGPEGLLAAQKLVIEWRDGENAPRQTETTPVRVSEIVLADGPTCRFAGTGATLAFEGRRVSYTCGTKDGHTVALLGELEPVEGGFRIVRARFSQREQGFTLVSSEPILVTAPR